MFKDCTAGISYQPMGGADRNCSRGAQLTTDRDTARPKRTPSGSPEPPVITDFKIWIGVLYTQINLNLSLSFPHTKVVTSPITVTSYWNIQWQCLPHQTQSFFWHVWYTILFVFEFFYIFACFANFAENIIFLAGTLFPMFTAFPFSCVCSC